MLSSPDIETVNLGIRSLKDTNFKTWISSNIFKLPLGESKDGYRLAILVDESKSVRFMMHVSYLADCIINNEMDIPLSIKDCVNCVKKFEDENQ